MCKLTTFPVKGNDIDRGELTVYPFFAELNLGESTRVFNVYYSLITHFIEQ